MRVIDYLQSRPDIRADRIGCTGNSGGGTETAYLMALDDRILAAAPGCYLTTFRRLMETRGPQDGEQNIAGQIAFGMDEADYCNMRAPKPTLILAATRDATFDFGGTMDLFRESKRFYSRLGYPERLEIAAPDAPHGFTLQLREAAVQFMSRWLLGKDVEVREIPRLPDSLTDEELRNLTQPDWTAAQLQCTPQGQVLLLPGERSAFQINAETAARLRERRGAVWSALAPDARRRLVRETIHAADSGKKAVEFRDVEDRGGFSSHRIAMAVAPGVQLAAVAYVPDNRSGPATLYLDGKGLGEAAAPDSPARQLVSRGHVVLAAELRGIGQTETGHDKSAFGAGRFGPDNLEIFTAYLIGRSFVGMRTEDAIAWSRFLAEWTAGGSKPTEVHLVAVGEAAIPAVHAAALAPETFRSVSLRQMIDSWESLVAAPESFNQSVNVVHGGLRHYDLPDLLKLLPAGSVNVSESVDAMGRPLAR